MPVNIKIMSCSHCLEGYCDIASDLGQLPTKCERQDGGKFICNAVMSDDGKTIDCKKANLIQVASIPTNTKFIV